MAVHLMGGVQLQLRTLDHFIDEVNDRAVKARRHFESMDATQLRSTEVSVQLEGMNTRLEAAVSVLQRLGRELQSGARQAIRRAVTKPPPPKLFLGPGVQHKQVVRTQPSSSTSATSTVDPAPVAAPEVEEEAGAGLSRPDPPSSSTSSLSRSPAAAEEMEEETSAEPACPAPSSSSFSPSEASSFHETEPACPVLTVKAESACSSLPSVCPSASAIDTRARTYSRKDPRVTRPRVSASEALASPPSPPPVFAPSFSECAPPSPNPPPLPQTPFTLFALTPPVSRCRNRTHPYVRRPCSSSPLPSPPPSEPVLSSLRVRFQRANPYAHRRSVVSSSDGLASPSDGLASPANRTDSSSQVGGRYNLRRDCPAPDRLSYLHGFKASSSSSWSCKFI